MNWYTDPTQVPSPPKKKYGGWQYEYTRKKSGPISSRPGSMTIDYGPHEGEWLAKRKWEGEKPPGYNPYSPKTRTLPASWSPTANQFPWAMRKGITSDPQRQAAYSLGMGGGRQTVPVKKAFGTYFDPKSGFGSSGTAPTVISKFSSGQQPKSTPSFAQLPQIGSVPWAQESSATTNRNFMNWLRRMRGY